MLQLPHDVVHKVRRLNLLLNNAGAHELLVRCHGGPAGLQASVKWHCRAVLALVYKVSHLLLLLWRENETAATEGYLVPFSHLHWLVLLELFKDVGYAHEVPALIIGHGVLGRVHLVIVRMPTPEECLLVVLKQGFLLRLEIQHVLYDLVVAVAVLVRCLVIEQRLQLRQLTELTVGHA